VIVVKKQFTLHIQLTAMGIQKYSFTYACPLCFWRAWPPFLWRGVLGKSGCCEEKYNPIIIRDAGGDPRTNPWQHLVSPIRFANGGT